MRSANKYLAAGLLVFFLILALQAASHLASGFLAPRIQEAMEKRLDAKVRIEGFDFGFFTGTRMDSIVIEASSTAGCESEKTSLSGIKIDHALISLLGGRYRPAAIEIQTLQACLDKRLFGLLSSLDIDRTNADAFPAINLENGNIKIDHPALRRPFQINDLKVSGKAGRMLRIQAGISAGSEIGGLEMHLATDGHGIEADVYAKDFELSSLPAIETGQRGFDPSLIMQGQKVSGKFSMLLSADGRTLRVQNGLFDAAGGTLRISSAGLDFTKKGIQNAWIRGDANGLNCSFMKNFRQRFHLYETIGAEIHQGRFNAVAFARWDPGRGLDYEADL